MNDPGSPPRDVVVGEDGISTDTGTDGSPQDVAGDPNSGDGGPSDLTTDQFASHDEGETDIGSDPGTAPDEGGDAQQEAGPDATGSEQVIASGRIGPAGGALFHPAIELIVPPGAVTEEHEFTIRTTRAPEGLPVVGDFYRLAPTNLYFLVPLTIRFIVPDSERGKPLAAFLSLPGSNDRFQDVTLRVGGNVVMGLVPHFSAAFVANPGSMTQGQAVCCEPIDPTQGSPQDCIFNPVTGLACDPTFCQPVPGGCTAQPPASTAPCPCKPFSPSVPYTDCLTCDPVKCIPDPQYCPPTNLCDLCDDPSFTGKPEFQDAYQDYKYDFGFMNCQELKVLDTSPPSASSSAWCFFFGLSKWCAYQDLLSEAGCQNGPDTVASQCATPPPTGCCERKTPGLDIPPNPQGLTCNALSAQDCVTWGGGFAGQYCAFVPGTPCPPAPGGAGCCAAIVPGQDLPTTIHGYPNAFQCADLPETECTTFAGIAHLYCQWNVGSPCPPPNPQGGCCGPKVPGQDLPTSIGGNPNTLLCQDLPETECTTFAGIADQYCEWKAGAACPQPPTSSRTVPCEECDRWKDHPQFQAQYVPNFQWFSGPDGPDCNTAIDIVIPSSTAVNPNDPHQMGKYCGYRAGIFVKCGGNQNPWSCTPLPVVPQNPDPASYCPECLTHQDDPVFQAAWQAAVSTYHSLATCADLKNQNVPLPFGTPGSNLWIETLARWCAMQAALQGLGCQNGPNSIAPVCDPPGPVSYCPACDDPAALANPEFAAAWYGGVEAYVWGFGNVTGMPICEFLAQVASQGVVPPPPGLPPQAHATLLGRWCALQKALGNYGCQASPTTIAPVCDLGSCCRLKVGMSIPPGHPSCEDIAKATPFCEYNPPTGPYCEQDPSCTVPGP